jgi:UDP-N-acetylmuramoyl-tripeptide--D-alanyl-D-alanine ligase
MREKIAYILRWQAIRFLNKYAPKVIVITGSVGKTSATQAITTVLSESYTVRSTLLNYNTDIGVPCSIFAQKIPSSIKNPFSWVILLLKNEISILKKPPFEVIVLELGTDTPGDIASYSWLSPDVAVVTAIAPEHMEFFKTIEAVAREELAVGQYSEKVIINKNMVESEYLRFIDNDQVFNYSREDVGHLNLKKEDLQVVGNHSIDAVAAAIAVGRAMGLSNKELVVGAKKICTPKGRMRLLSGIKNSTLIDDTYNASPKAVIAALDYLYSVKAPQRIALLGNMNELGESSVEAHKQIGKYCDAKKLDLVITLGPDASVHTFETAKDNNCRVEKASSPYEAAEIIKRNLKEGAYILFKGSQNGVFAEEAVKMLLDNPEDELELVRQSRFWLKKKASNFQGV